MFAALDRQLQRFSPRLRDDLGLTPAESQAVASSVAVDLRSVDHAVLDGDDQVDFLSRYEEVLAFQGFMEATAPVESSPFVARARVLVQNYVCFVYLKESWLERLRDAAPVDSVLHKCARYLTSGRVRAFRNAVSHARWRYLGDFSGIEYWDRASPNRSAPLQRLLVDQLELDFWQTLIRGICYTAAEVRRAAR